MAIYTPFNSGDAGDAATVYHDAQTEWLFSAFTPLPGRTRPLPPPQPVSHSVCSALGEAEGNANGSRGAESEAEKSHSVCAS